MIALGWRETLRPSDIIVICLQGFAAASLLFSIAICAITKRWTGRRALSYRAVIGSEHGPAPVIAVVIRLASFCAAMIRPCAKSDFEVVRAVINDAAIAYKDTIPPQLYREPWMSEEYFEDEISRGVKFLGFEDNQNIVGVMGVQDVKDVTLVRHSYVRTNQRRNGIGGALLDYHIAHSSRPILVGCLKAMTWAISFYQKHGFTLVSEEERDELRAKYWNLSPEHVRNSVVLVDQKWLSR